MIPPDIVIRIIPNKDNLDKTIREILQNILTPEQVINPGVQPSQQQNLPENPVCSKCGKTVDQKVVNFCKVRYKGTILCRECQEGA